MKEEAQRLYEGKYFYEIVKPISGRFAGTIQLVGPLYNIRYRNGQPGFTLILHGKAQTFFEPNEILVTDRIL